MLRLSVMVNHRVTQSVSLIDEGDNSVAWQHTPDPVLISVEIFSVLMHRLGDLRLHMHTHTRS